MLTTPSPSSSEFVIVPDDHGDATKKAGGMHKLWHCAGTREAAPCKHGINLSGYLLCGDHWCHRFHCSESGVARPLRVNSPTSAWLPGCVWSSPLRSHLTYLWANRASAASRVIVIQ